MTTNTGQKFNNPTYRAWAAMLCRCRNKNHEKYHRYGGRGITVCDRWLKFEIFKFDMGERPTGLSLDRINNDGNYEPGNCRWATMKTQRRNSSINRILEFRGISRPMIEWAELYNINVGTLRDRLRRGWGVEKAITHPVRFKSGT